jgi:hypothetical protein
LFFFALPFVFLLRTRATELVEFLRGFEEFSRFFHFLFCRLTAKPALSSFRHRRKTFQTRSGRESETTHEAMPRLMSPLSQAPLLCVLLLLVGGNQGALAIPPGLSYCQPVGANPLANGKTLPAACAPLVPWANGPAAQVYVPLAYGIDYDALVSEAVRTLELVDNPNTPMVRKHKSFKQATPPLLPRRSLRADRKCLCFFLRLNIVPLR